MSEMIKPDWKAKRIDNGEWLEGTGITEFVNVGKPTIFCVWGNWGKYNGWVEVDPATLCRNTTAEIEGKAVWEGDLFRNRNAVLEVVWDKEALQWQFAIWINGVKNERAYYITADILGHSAHVGNRFDNPELLGAK